MLKRKRNRQIAEINVVPYIDVMLVLLVIFMVTAPLLSQGVKVNLPSAAARPISSQQPEPIIVSVDARGNYYLNISSTPGQPIAASDLVQRVSSELQQDQSSKQRQILIKGDKDVDYGRVVKMMVLLQQAGAPSVGLITQPEDEH